MAQATATQTEGKNLNKAMSNEEATRKTLASKGEALAVLIVEYANAEQADQLKRGEKRMNFVRSIVALSPEGHQEFRKQLQNELAFMAESAKILMKDAGDIVKEDEQSKAGYTSNSFRVMVSCFRTISTACELGWKLEPASMSWDQALSECRAYRKVKAAAGVQVAIPGTRKQGAGRKVLTPLAKVQGQIAKLSTKEKKTLLVTLAAELGFTLAAIN